MSDMNTKTIFDREDPEIVWVCAEDVKGKGSYDAPFGKLTDALQVVKPGEAVVLKSGVYTHDQTIEISGSVERPIQICSEDDAGVIIQSACWFFYDVCDLIVSDLTFKDSPHGSLSVIGNCRRNRFHNLQFYNCGTAEKTSCAVFFGGGGARFNLFENCTFENPKNETKTVTAENASIAMMISDGDNESSQLIKNHIFRRNTFRNYDYGIIVGTRAASGFNSGHIVEYNTIENCNEDGIVVKVGDTQVRANLLANCRTNSISVAAGIGTVIENNRVIDGFRGILVKDFGQTISNNCIIRCSKEAIRVSGKSDSENSPASNLFIQQNTFIDCGKSTDNHTEKSPLSPGLAIEQGSSCIIEKNLVCTSGAPYRIETAENSTAQTNCVIMDNLCCGTQNIADGFRGSDVAFSNAEEDDYRNSSGYGANGPMLTPAAFDPQEQENQEVDYVMASVLEDEEGNVIIPDDSEDSNPFSSLPDELIDFRNQLDEDS